MAIYKDAEDLINIGAYIKGSNPSIDQSIQSIQSIENFMKQDMNESITFEQIITELNEVLQLKSGET
jgi:flagellum-specific ATP synthase